MSFPQRRVSWAASGRTRHREPLAQAARLYKGTNLRGARVIVVYLDFPAERPSASLSQGVVVVSPTSHGYIAWARVR